MRRPTPIIVMSIFLCAFSGTSWSQDSTSGDRPGSRLDRLLERYEDDLKGWAEEDLPGAYGRVGGAFDAAGDVLEAGAAVADLFESYAALDGECDVDRLATNTPRMPSGCAESEDCGACYEQAQRKLNSTRVTLERLRCIGVKTKAMKDDAMAVGESFASFPGMGLGWYAARRDISTGWQYFVNAYDAKYQQLLGSLEGALIGIGQCEAQYFDEPDWYYRYGFIYQQFMTDSYHPRSVLD